METRTIVVLEGDDTGQELLDEALRVLAPDVVGLELELPRYDLSLESRRATANEVVHDAARAVREHGLYDETVMFVKNVLALTGRPL